MTTAPKKVALLGFDCALTSLVRQHIAEGIAPNFKKIFEGGVVCENALVPFPTITPPNWTVMATGAWPITNQICDFWRHVPGRDVESTNTHSCFNWDHCQAESIWEAAEKAGKKSIVFNFPMGYNAQKKAKNATVVGGAGLTPGLFMDGDLGWTIKNPANPGKLQDQFYAGSSDILVATTPYPGFAYKVKFEKTDWKNIDTEGKDDALSASFPMVYPDSIFDFKPTEWHVLVRDMSGKGYDTMTLSTSKDFKDALCTIKTGEWAKAFDVKAELAKGGHKVLRCKPKLITLSDDAEDFKLLIPAMLNKDGEAWCHPLEKAALMNTGDNIATNGTGFSLLPAGWIDLDIWMEMIAIHYEWLADATTALLKNPAEWDIFYSHAHPTDFIYHALMTDLDPTTCASKAAYEKAWECHRKLYKAADAYLGKVMGVMTDDTLVTLISDHGATPDGPAISTQHVLEQAGLCKRHPINWDDPMLAAIPENLKEVMVQTMLDKVDHSQSKAIAERMCFVYVNLKSKFPHGIVEDKDYEKVQREIIDALMTYVDPKSGKRPFIMALPKKEAMLIGQGGEQCGDVVYALFPEYTMQHGPLLPTSEYGIGTLKTLLVFYGPKCGIKQGYSMQRVCNIVDCVPTYCYMTGWPIPQDAEGSVIYQIMDNPNMRP